MGELADAREDSFDILLELLESALANSDYSQSEIESLIDISKDDLYSMTLPIDYSESSEREKWLEAAIAIIHENYLNQ
jgi:hypothetical protein